MSLEPDDAELLLGAIEARLVDLHTIKVGKVQSYDSELQVADVVCVMRRPYNIGDGEVDHEEFPVIPNVPVVWPRAGGFVIHMPLKKGDHVVLGFTDDNIAMWRQSGSVSDPDDLRRHDLGSAICFAGITPALDVLSINPLDVLVRAAGMYIGEDGTPRLLCWDDSGITAGRPDPLTKRVSPVALADRTEARITALEGQLTTVSAALIALTATVAAGAAAAATDAATFASHTHNVPAPVGAPTGPAIGTLAPGGPPGAPPSPFVPVPLPVAADTLNGTGPLP